MGENKEEDLLLIGLLFLLGKLNIPNLFIPGGGKKKEKDPTEPDPGDPEPDPGLDPDPTPSPDPEPEPTPSPVQTDPVIDPSPDPIPAPDEEPLPDPVPVPMVETRKKPKGIKDTSYQDPFKDFKKRFGKDPEKRRSPKKDPIIEEDPIEDPTRAPGIPAPPPLHLPAPSIPSVPETDTFVDPVPPPYTVITSPMTATPAVIETAFAEGEAATGLAAGIAATGLAAGAGLGAAALLPAGVAAGLAAAAGAGATIGV